MMLCEQRISANSSLLVNKACQISANSSLLVNKVCQISANSSLLVNKACQIYALIVRVSDNFANSKS